MELLGKPPSIRESKFCIPVPIRIALDASTWALLAANIITIYLAITEDWGVMTVLWAYWCQSVIIGIFSFLKIMDSREGGIKTRENYATIFVSVYGIFHLVYAFFLAMFTLMGTSELALDSAKGIFGQFTKVDFSFVLLAAAIFFANHLFSFFFNRKENRMKQPDAFMGTAIARIIPMHITIILAFLLGPSTLIFFMALKTIIDVLIHVHEHGTYYLKEKIDLKEFTG